MAVLSLSLSNYVGYNAALLSMKKKKDREEGPCTKRYPGAALRATNLFALLCTLTFTPARTSSSRIAAILRRFVPHAPCRVQTRRCSPVRERLWESKGTRTAGEWYLLKRKDAIPLPPSPSLSLTLEHTHSHIFPVLLVSPRSPTSFPRRSASRYLEMLGLMEG